MKSWLEKIHNFLFKKQELDINCSNDMLALVRLSCLSTIVFMLCNIVFIRKVFKYTSIYFSLLFLCIAIIVIFVFTYLNHKYNLILLYLYSALVLCLLTFLELWCDASIGYHWGMLCVIFLIFYKTGNKKYKCVDYISSIFLVLYSFFVWFISLKTQRHFQLPLSFQDIFILNVFFMFWAGFSIILIAWFYHYKFTKSEEDLVNYATQLESISLRDTLTNLINRRGIFDYVETVNKKDTFIVMCDIDFFKTVNDTYGHDIGDTVLKRIAEVLLMYIGNKGVVSRWGGEEFLIVISKMKLEEVVDLMEQVRMFVARETFVVTEKKNFFVTITCGVAEYNTEGAFLDSVKIADENLYLGKEQGRNRVVY